MIRDEPTYVLLVMMDGGKVFVDIYVYLHPFGVGISIGRLIYKRQ
jgi:hypothetical protein